MFGLIPHWSKDTTIARRTYNARSETVAEKPSYRDAWRLGRRCIIRPMPLRAGLAQRQGRWRHGFFAPTASRWAWQASDRLAIARRQHRAQLQHADHQRRRPPADETVPQAAGGEAHGGGPSRGSLTWTGCRPVRSRAVISCRPGLPMN